MSDSNLDHTQPVNVNPAQSAAAQEPAAATQRIAVTGEPTQKIVLDPNLAATQKMTVSGAGPAPAVQGNAAGAHSTQDGQPGSDGAGDGGPTYPAANEPPTQPRKRRRWVIILGGILLILLLGAGGGFLGYRAAQQATTDAFAASVTERATEQFMLGLQAQADGHFELALQHLQYVIQLDANFPGAQAKLTEVMLALATEKTPTPEVILPTITPSPTPDFRGEEEIFNNAKALLANKEWYKALEVLDTLRNKNLGYRVVEVDGMYYVGLRNRGLYKVSAGELEEGLYDLAVVEQFGPLDIDAQGVRNWARLYITGSRFWGVRWDKVVEAFAEIYPAFPSMHDSSGVTATDRFRIASLKYGEQLMAEGKYCEALQQYQNAQSIGSDGALDATATAVYNACYPPTATPGPTATFTPTVTLGITPVETTPAATVNPGVTEEPTVEVTTEVPPPGDTTPSP